MFRFLGLVVMTLGFLVVVHDGTKSLADQTVYITKVGPAWENTHPNSLKAFGRPYTATAVQKMLRGG